MALGELLDGLLEEGSLHLLLLQAFGASKDPDVLRVSRRRMGQMYEYVQQATGESDERVQRFFSQGMLLTVAAGLDLPAITERTINLQRFMDTTVERARSVDPYITLVAPTVTVSRWVFISRALPLPAKEDPLLKGASVILPTVASAPSGRAGLPAFLWQLL